MFDARQDGGGLKPVEPNVLMISHTICGLSAFSLLGLHHIQSGNTMDQVPILRLSCLGMCKLL